MTGKPDITIRLSHEMGSFRGKFNPEYRELITEAIKTIGDLRTALEFIQKSTNIANTHHIASDALKTHAPA
jgi:hypothetical protein